MTEDQTKIALVTGSSRGLGKNTALSLARKGVAVIVTYHRNDESVSNVVSSIEALGAKAVALQLDTANTRTFDGFVEQVKQSLQDKWQTEQFDFLLPENVGGVIAFAQRCRRLVYRRYRFFAIRRKQMGECPKN